MAANEENDRIEEATANVDSEPEQILSTSPVKKEKQQGVAATPALTKRCRVANQHIMNSPTDNIFSPISKLLLKKRMPKN